MGRRSSRRRQCPATTSGRRGLFICKGVLAKASLAKASLAKATSLPPQEAIITWPPFSQYKHTSFAPKSGWGMLVYAPGWSLASQFELVILHEYIHICKLRASFLDDTLRGQPVELL